jgi:hypothetical protein
LGNELEVLFSGNKSAGIHRVTWSASNYASGIYFNYASGIYFYTINAGTFNQVKKMIMIK